MATILLNESDPVRHELLRLRLQRQGHKVWSAHHLNLFSNSRTAKTFRAR